MLFMVIGTWEPDKVQEITKRAGEKGAGVPEGVRVIGEWTDAAGRRIVRVLEADDATSLLVASLGWNDLMTIEVFPVVGLESSIDTAGSV